ncbi:MAG: tRNA uridine-5-carboxymethylaminomethyl(34) synthesis enzyme MnmG [Clostridiales bacterium]|nr:tRNA uridine-5-carboxymethylaminomethyl(34) synthesis enzyme MnmG [Clostridiales bacterium]
MEVYQVIVIGGGHAGIEAALAAARLGAKTLLISQGPDSLALMPCNPAIGGPAKSILVREIDALGGFMARAADKSQIQIRLLNQGKGPAVQALRAQIDKPEYQKLAREALFSQKGLAIAFGEVKQFLISQDQIEGVLLTDERRFSAENIVLAAGTYLGGRIFIGDMNYFSGPLGYPPVLELSAYLKSLGLPLTRFKTGTPARVSRNSLDFESMCEQKGDDSGLAFSFLTKREEARARPRRSCWLTYTNPRTHQIIRDNLHLSALFSGDIKGVGPRYCPSIEDKVTRFAERDSHQLFLEPEDLAGQEFYVQGMSSSLPREVQLDFLRSIEGLKQVEILRPAYAIEYDCLLPSQLCPTLEHKQLKGFFSAGQINGSSGYEEAAGQGLWAGANAALRALGQPPFHLSRAQAYLGVMVDDLVTKGVEEPYRLFTSLAEYRLLLRQDNADLRLIPLAKELGLVSPARYEAHLEKETAIQEEIKRLESIRPGEEELRGLDIEGKGDNLAMLLRRPGMTYEKIAAKYPSRENLEDSEREQVEVSLKYAGYIEKQKQQVASFERLEGRRLPEGLDYQEVRGLSAEASQKLSRIRPQTIGQASRISGVSPGDLNVLLVWLTKNRGTVR